MVLFCGSLCGGLCRLFCVVNYFSNSYKYGSRKFYEFVPPEQVTTEHDEEVTELTLDKNSTNITDDLKSNIPEHLMQYIQNNLIGRDRIFASPFGPRKGLLLLWAF